MRRKLAMAVTERVDCPATYNRIIQFSSGCGLSFLSTRDLEEGGFRTGFFDVATLLINNSPRKTTLPLFSPWSLKWTAVNLRWTAVNFAAPGHRRPIFPQVIFAFVFDRNRSFHLRLVCREFSPERFYLSLHRFALAFELGEFELALVGALERGVAFLGLGSHACRTREHPAGSKVNLDQLDPFSAQDELANLVGVMHSARLQYVKPAVAFAGNFDVPRQQPGVDD